MDTDIFSKLSSNRYIRGFSKDVKLILSAILVIFMWSVIYLLLFYSPTYESEAKVWIKDLATEEYVASLDTQSQLTPLTSAGNPILTQIEILKSNQLKQTIAEYKSTFGEEVDSSSIKIDVKNKPNTDILNIAYGDNSREKAQDVLKVILEEYENINLSINRKIRTSRREYIDSKLAEINDKLYEARKKVKDYKEKNLAISVDEESTQLVDQKVSMSTKLEDTVASIKSTAATVSELEKQLSLKPQQAINAVALGSGNKLLTDLRGELNDAVQEYEFDSAKLADTNPKMVAQRNKISTINKQIKNQIILSIGKFAKTQRINIFDPVRESLVRDLAENQTDFMGLLAEEQAINNSIKKVKAEESKIPEQKFVLDTLEQQEKVLSDAYDQLKEKQIEARIKEAEAVSNIVVVDTPSLPKGVSFPSKFQVLVISLMLGLMSGLSLSVLKTLIEDVCDDIITVEEITGVPAIGSIPWIENFLPDDQIQFIHGLAYDNIVSNLMMKCYKNDIKVLTFTSSSLRKPQSAILYYLAKSLNKLGQSVVVVDSDFRIPNIIKSAELEDKLKTNLSDLIVSVESKLRKKMEVEYKEIKEVLVVDESGISYLGNKDLIFEPYEFFGTMGFEKIIDLLKTEFDWVLVDTGAAHITPEFLMVSKLSDGVVLFVNKTITNTMLANITKALKQAHIPLIGTIIREPGSRLEKEYEKYLRFQQDKLLDGED